MKLAVQSDYYIRQYGVEEGILRMKKIGYENAVYTVNDRYDAPFTTQWGDPQIKEAFGPMGEAFSRHGIKPLYISIGNELYNDLIPQTFEARKKMAEHCARACAYMGCDTLAVKPVAFYRGDAAYYEKTKALTFEAFDRIRSECDRLGLRMAIINNAPNYAMQIPYGCRPEELAELCERYNASFVFSPLNGAGAMVDFGQVLSLLKDRLLAFCIEDADASAKKPCFPMMGCLDYASLYEQLGECPCSAYGVMMAAVAYRRYRCFAEHGGLFDALDDLLYSMGDLLCKERGGEAQ